MFGKRLTRCGRELLCKWMDQTTFFRTLKPISWSQWIQTKNLVSIFKSNCHQYRCKPKEACCWRSMRTLKRNETLIMSKDMEVTCRHLSVKGTLKCLITYHCFLGSKRNLKKNQIPSEFGRWKCQKNTESKIGLNYEEFWFQRKEK